MRQDFSSVVVERPRFIQSSAHSFRGARRRIRNALERDGETAPVRLPMRVGFRSCSMVKTSTDHVVPQRRWIAKQVGRPWAQVHSELCRHLARDGAAGWLAHVHVEGYVTPIHVVHPTRARAHGYDRWHGSPTVAQLLDPGQRPSRSLDFVNSVSGRLGRACRLPPERSDASTAVQQGSSAPLPGARPSTPSLRHSRAHGSIRYR